MTPKFYFKEIPKMEQKTNLQKLRADLEQAKLEKIQAEHQLKRAESRLSYRKGLSRKARTHQLIVLGAIMEQYFPELKDLSEAKLGEVIGALDLELFHKAMYEAIEKRGKEVNA